MSIPIERFQEIIEESGLKAHPQSAYWKISAGNRAIYVARTNLVSRVDFSGFQFKHPAVSVLSKDQAGKLKVGRVQAQLNFGLNDESVLEAFRTGLETMKHLAAAPVDDEQAGREPEPPRTPPKGASRKSARGANPRRSPSKGTERRAH